MKYLEEALDFYLGGKTVAVNTGDTERAERNRDATSIPTNSRPELKLWEVEP